jgi:hypothetical protein
MARCRCGGKRGGGVPGAIARTRVLFAGERAAARGAGQKIARVPIRVSTSTIRRGRATAGRPDTSPRLGPTWKKVPGAVPLSGGLADAGVRPRSRLAPGDIPRRDAEGRPRRRL